MNDFSSSGFLPRTSNRYYELLLISLDHAARARQRGTAEDQIKSILGAIDGFTARAGSPAGFATWIQRSCQNEVPCQGSRQPQCIIGPTVGYFTSPEMHPSCPSEIRARYGLALGKSDIGVMICANGELEASALRTAIHRLPGVRTIQSVPCARLVYEFDRVVTSGSTTQGNAERIGIRDDSYDASPARFVCYTACRFKRDYTSNLNVISDAFGTFKNEWREAARSSGRPDPRLEGYLTLGDYHLLIKYETSTFLDASNLLADWRRIHAAILHSTSTHVFLPLERPGDLDTWANCADDVGDPQGAPNPKVGLLLWVNTAAIEALSTGLKALFLEEGFTPPEEIRVHRQHGFWDLRFTLPCRNLHRFVALLLRRVLSEPGILATRILPYHPGADSTNSDGAGNAPSSASGTPDPQPGGQDPDLVHDHSLNSDPVLRKFEDLQAYLFWNHQRIAQFKEDWERREELPGNATIGEILTQSKRLLDRADANRYRSATDGQKVQYVDTLRNLANGLIEKFESVVALYNECLEGSHLGAVTESNPRVGEHAGVFSLVLRAIGNLMRDCCGEMMPPSDGDSPSTPTRFWNGLVTTNAGRDFGVVPQLSLLYAPAAIKLSAGNLLVSLPHEAGHCIYHWLRDASGDSPPRRQLTGIVQTIYRRLIKAYETPARAGMNPERVETLAEEIFCDIVGYLIGGPSYACAHDSFHYVPRGIQTGRKYSLSSLTRIKIGLHVASCQGLERTPWYTLLRGLEDTALALETRLGPPGGPGAINRHFAYTDGVLEVLLSKTGSRSLLGRISTFFSTTFDRSPLYFPPGCDPAARYVEVLELARRMAYGWEIPFDAKPVDLVAADALLQYHPELRVNYFRWRCENTLRLYLALAYNRTP